jgi:hypothetical protein
VVHAEQLLDERILDPSTSRIVVAFLELTVGLRSSMIRPTIARIAGSSRDDATDGRLDAVVAINAASRRCFEPAWRNFRSSTAAAAAGSSVRGPRTARPRGPSPGRRSSS